MCRNHCSATTSPTTTTGPRFRKPEELDQHARTRPPHQPDQGPTLTRIEIKNFSHRELTDDQTKALAWLAEQHPAADRIEAWGFGDDAVRARTGPAGLDDWIIEPDGTTRSRHAGRVIKQVWP